MDRIGIRARVRPQRFVALVGPSVTPGELTSLTRILSSTWAGRYTPMIRVNDPLAAADVRNITGQGPDVLLGAGLDMTAAAHSLATQLGALPHLAVPADPHDFFASPFQPVHIDFALRRVVRENPAIDQSRVTVWDIPEVSPLFHFYTWAFGFHSRNALDFAVARLSAERRIVAVDATISQFIENCAYMGSRVSWLDLGSYGLNTTASRSDLFFTPPTIVLVGVGLHQLTDYWNVRSQLTVGASGAILPLPLGSCESVAVVNALSAWITAARVDADFLRILCDAEHVPAARRLAYRLRRRLTTTRYKNVDVQLLHSVVPVILAVDSEQHVDAGAEFSVVTFDPPHPQSIDAGQDRYYMVDLLKDRETGRSPRELFLPQQRVVIDVLRAAAPPSFSFGREGIGLSFGNVSLRVDQSSTCRFQVPTAEELFGEILTDAGFKRVRDEKQLRYQTVLNMFGGLAQTAQALLGFSGRLLSVLAKKGPLKTTELYGSLGRFQNSRRRTPASDWLDETTEHWSPAMRRVTRSRFDQYRMLQIRSGDPLLDLLAKFCKLHIVSRVYRPDPCPACLDDTWINQVDLSNGLHCSTCGSERSPGASLPIGYVLNSVVRTALNEGITPVVLTARFLYNMTSNGFLWLPGIKATRENQTVDFDIMAMCDGVLVTAECKDLQETPKTSGCWKTDVVPQYLSLVRYSRDLGVNVVLLSALANAFPPVVDRAVSKARSLGIGARQISGEALERGWEELDSATRRLSLRTLLPPQPKERRLRNRKGPRHISMHGIRQESDGT